MAFQAPEQRTQEKRIEHEAKDKHMYHTESQTAMYDHSRVESSLPAWPRGPQALLFGPGWLVLKLMDAILQCPGSEASWRDEVRRQCHSSFYGRVYGVIFWLMLALAVGILLVS